MRNASISLPALAAVGALALVLAVIPLPEVLRSWRPNPLLLLLLYCIHRQQEGIGVAMAFTLGLLYDGLVGAPLGAHALSFTLVSGALLLVQHPWRMATREQQLLGVMVLVMAEQLIAIRAIGFSRAVVFPLSLLLPVLSAGLVWWLVAWRNGRRWDYSLG